MTDDNNPMIEELTPREFDVLKLLVEAHSNREISEKLNVSVETIRTHTKRIYSKLNVSGRQEASFRAIQLGLVNDPIYVTTPTATNLHARYDTFIGRKRELSDLSELFTNGDRFISIVGVGGMGKTRLAIEFAQQAYTRYPHGIYIVELESITDADGIILQIADSISLQLVGKESASQQILTYLQNKEILLIIDNCEHLLEDLTFLRDMLQSSSHLHILATSRERLNLRQETVYALGGLSIPTENITVQDDQTDAVQLLLDFAHRVQSQWQITDDNRDAVYELCHLTQGMPLAIMLAASWIDVYSLSRIVTEIKRNIDFLAGDFRDMLDRHRSMRAVFDWTWQLLTDAERDVLKKFSVFFNGGLLDAVETITNANPRILKSLVSKALIQRDVTGRYRVHPLHRQYFVSKLQANTQSEIAIKTIHATYFINLSVDMMTNKIYGDSIQIEMGNLLAAWYWAVDTKQIDLLWRGFNNYGMIAYQLGALRDMLPLYQYAIQRLDHAENSELIACLYYIQASFLIYFKQDDLADHAIKRGKTLLNNINYDDVRIEVIFALYHLALAQRYFNKELALDLVEQVIIHLENRNLITDDVAQTMLAYAYSQIPTIHLVYFNESNPMLERYALSALKIANTIKHRFMIAYSTQYLGELATRRHDFETAMNHIRTSYDAYQGLSQSFDYIFLLTQAGSIAKQLGYEDEALKYWYRALLLFRNYRFLHGIYVLILDIVEWKIQQGDWLDATLLLGFCGENAVRMQERERVKEIKVDMSTRLDEATYTKTIAHGRSLSYDEIVTQLIGWLNVKSD